MTLEQISAFVAIAATLIGGFTFLIRSITRGTNALVTKMASNHSDMIRPIIEDVKMYTKVDQRLTKVENDTHEIREQHSASMEKMDNISERIDKIYNILLDNVKH